MQLLLWTSLLSMAKAFRKDIFSFFSTRIVLLGSAKAAEVSILWSGSWEKTMISEKRAK